MSKVKRAAKWLLILYVCVPFVVKLCPSIQAKLVFLNFGKSAGRPSREAARRVTALSCPPPPQ